MSKPLFEQSADPNDAHHPTCRDREECFVTAKECRDGEMPSLSENALETVPRWGLVAKDYRPPKGSPITLQSKGFWMSSGMAEKFKEFFK